MQTVAAGKNDRVQVWCRLRSFLPEDDVPEDGGAGAGAAFLTPQDESESSCFDSFDGTTGECVYRKPSDGNGDGKRFRFDGLLEPGCSQASVFDAVAAGIVDGCLEGFNGAVLAYGQTGSGKTHSMRGADAHDSWAAGTPGSGIVPRALARLFTAKEAAPGVHGDVSLSVSCVQIYCELLQDLVDPRNPRPLSIVEKDGAVIVPHLTRVPVDTLAQCLDVLRRSDEARAVSATKLNAHSSRSHAAYIIHVERRDRAGSGAGDAGGGSKYLAATLTLVDLAGCERVKRSGVQYQALEETKAINLSLSALGNCVAALAAGREHVPYRDSKLTRLLSQSLGGNARTALLVALRPGADPHGENLSSLTFAARAGLVTLRAVRNERVDYASLYASAQAALDGKDDAVRGLELTVAALEAKLAASERRAEEAEAARRGAEEALARAAAGYAASVQLGSSSGGGGGGGGAGAGGIRGGGGADGGEQAVAAVEAVSGRWRAELDALAAGHASHVAELQGRWEAQLEAYKRAAATANAEWSGVEADLTAERSGYLECLQQQRELRESYRTLERESSARVAELLGDLSARDDRERELTAALESARRTADLSLSKATELAGRLEGLEAAHGAHAASLGNDYVSRAKVGGWVEREGERERERGEKCTRWHTFLFNCDTPAGSFRACARAQADDSPDRCGASRRAARCAFLHHKLGLRYVLTRAAHARMRYFCCCC